MNLTALILLVLKISLALNDLALRLTESFSDATFLFRRPRQLSRAFLSMNVLMPLVAVILVLRFNLHPAVKIAIVALSMSPVPPIFPQRAFKAGGKENYTVGLLVAAALLAIVVVPLTMEILQRIVGVQLRMPARDVAPLVFRTILAPLLVGIGVRALAPSFAERTAAPIGRVSSVLLIVSVLPIFFSSSRAMLSLIGNGTLLSLAVFVLAGLIIGRLLGGPEPGDGRVLSLATALRHPGMAAAIAQANYPAQRLVEPAIALYLIVAGILSVLISAWRTRAKATKGGGQRAA